MALVGLFILGTLINEAFLSGGNLSNIFTRAAFIGIIAVGATFVITAGGIDLSVGSMAAFISGAMTIYLPPFLAAKLFLAMLKCNNGNQLLNVVDIVN